jgi:hypothetical protein
MLVIEYAQTACVVSYYVHRVQSNALDAVW